VRKGYVERETEREISEITMQLNGSIKRAKDRDGGSNHTAPMSDSRAMLTVFVGAKGIEG
jgi:hypothetical protein